VPAGRARAFFRFRHYGHTSADFSDFVNPGSRERLAFAARTTSSFPGAFEPARACVTGTSAPDGAVNMCGVSSETGVPDEGDECCVQLMDGGVLNNIPIGWAVRTIAGMAADKPVDRWLVFLQPVSPKPPAAPADRKSGSPSPARVMTLLNAMFKVKLGSESVLDGLQDLRTLTARSAELDAVLGATASTQLVGQGEATVHRAMLAYRNATGVAEVTRLRTLLTDPFSVIASDPLSIPADTFPLRDRIKANRGQELQELQMPPCPGDLVVPAATAFEQVGKHARTPLVPARVVTLLLYVVRAREAELGVELRDVRRELYSMRHAIETMIAIRDRMILQLAHRADDGLTSAQLLTAATAELDALLSSAGAKQPAGDEAGEVWRARAADLASAYDRWRPTLDPRGASWPDRPFESLWQSLERTADKINQQLQRQVGAGRLDVAQLVGGGDAAGRGLAALEVLTGAMRPDPLATASNIHLAVCSASNKSPIEGLIIDPPPDEDTRVDRKLSGNQISNFAAFLSARWRLTDWTWGRMDGAQTIVDVVAGQGRLDAITLGELESLFTAPLRQSGSSAETEQAWQQHLHARWSEYAKQFGRDPVGTARSAITERRQWEILAEELPVLEHLATRPGGHDRPPSTDELDALETERQQDAPPVPTTEQLHLLGDVGDESVFTLLPRSDLRRTLARLGFVGWSAVLPGGWPGAAFQVLIAWTVAPFLLAVLLALVAPVSTMFAASAIWVAVAAAAHEWASGTTIALGLSLVLAATTLTAQHWVPFASRRRRVAKAGFWTRTWWRLPVAVAVTVAAGVSVALWLLWRRPTAPPHLMTHTAWVSGVVAAVAVFVPLIYVATGTGVKGLFGRARSRGRKRNTGRWLLGVSAIAAAAGALSALVTAKLDGGTAGFMVLDVSLLATLLGLFLGFSGFLSRRPRAGAQPSRHTS
jgi:hypothetical protein